MTEGVSLKLLVLKTRQAERLRAFYESLGVSFTQEKHGDGPPHYAGQLGEVVLEVYPLAGDGTADSTTRLGFAVGDLSLVLESLRAAGTPVVSEPKATTWGLRAVVR